MILNKICQLGHSLCFFLINITYLNSNVNLLMRLISNQNTETHLTEILRAIESSEEIIICVAFLKCSGLNFLIAKINEKKGKVKFYVGLDFYLTEPTALRQLLNFGHKVFLTEKPKATFHPKIFYFKTKNNITAFVGSSNLTSGGLITNIETSVVFQSVTNSKIDNELKHTFNSFDQNSKIANSQAIDDYEKLYNLYKQKHKQADIEFAIEEEKIIEENKRIEEERLKKEAVDNKENSTKYAKNRFVITPQYLESWPLNFEKFKEFKKENNGNTIIPKTHELFSWNRKQKDLYNSINENEERAIPQNHLDLLNSENFYWGNPNEIQWMIKWENQLKLAIEYSQLNNQKYTWVTRNNNPDFKYKAQVLWCWQQRMRLKGNPNTRKITPYEIKRLKEVNFLEESENEGGKIKEDDFIERLIELSEFKEKQIKNGNRKWIPSQTDLDPKTADLGNWLNDKIEWIKLHLKNGTQTESAKEREKDFLELGIYVNGGIRKSYFEYNIKEYIEMRKKYPIENPQGEERKPYANILKWATEIKSQFNKQPEWRQIRLKEVGLNK